MDPFIGLRLLTTNIRKILKVMQCLETTNHTSDMINKGKL